MSKSFLLDTDILSNLMRKNEVVVKNAHNYLSEHRIFMFSVITKYEIMRGLKAKEATTQLERFLLFCNKCFVLPVDDMTVNKASSIHADLRKNGITIGDADILIGATALINGFGVVTNNYDHFKNIAGLNIENWLNS